MNEVGEASHVNVYMLVDDSDHIGMDENIGVVLLITMPFITFVAIITSICYSTNLAWYFSTFSYQI